MTFYSEFETFYVAAWHDSGVLLSPPATETVVVETAVGRAIRSGRTLFSAAAMAVGVALTATSLPAVSGTVLLGAEAKGTKASHFAAQQRGDVADRAPPGYWPRLVSAIKKAPRIQDQDEGAFPDPGI